ncbi:recombinase family protein [Bradyrhizobium sp. SSUT77]|uniref:recombinase family protein n=1 Tax=Bradyrhizobium sp. SSUT77 TaxID=3040603 RepID=UPI002449BE9B|nr:recombinase family protein [Bradyrhizobium sp. SSUT77]MDH2341530.1 recombinase family protein [Bradyrhizobium sp. SSUT77]
MTTQGTKRVAIYSRYSSDLQNDRSIEDQIAVCEKFAARQGWSVEGNFYDRAASGASLFGRPQFAKMVSEAHAGSFDIILSEDLDRLSRSQSDIAQLFEQMNFAEIEIHTLADGLINEMHIGVKGTMSALFLKGLAQKVRRGLAGTIRGGRSAGGDLYGYTPRKGEPGILDINPETSAVVKRIFEEYVGGASPRTIAAALNADNILAPRGGKWNASTINGNTARGQGLLLNERFVGRVVWNKRRAVKDPKTGRRTTRTNSQSEWVTQDVPHLRILTDELFNSARERRLAAGTPAARKRPKSQRLLSGLLRCGVCGSGMSLIGHDRSGPRVRCSRNRESGSCDNGTRYYIAKIESLVLSRLKLQIDNPGQMGRFVEAYLTERRALSADARRDKVKITAQVAACQKAIDNLIAAVEKGVLDIEEIAPRLEGQRAEKLRLQRELATADEKVATVDLHPTALKRFKANLEQISGAGDKVDPQIGAAFRELVDSVIVIPRKAGEPYTIETRGRLAALIGTPAGRPEAAQIALSMGAKAAPIGKAAVSAKSMVRLRGLEARHNRLIIHINL